ncbi:MAG: hypothetical protein HOF50_10855 [Candidatus Marinimicrobia bacterium]|nr:hypothetical protein [Candidatus Neomarinimicrobiota bacterium]
MLVHSNGRNSTEFCVGLRFARPTPTPSVIRSIKTWVYLTNTGKFSPLRPIIMKRKIQ